MSSDRPILLVGGSGYFGSLLARELLRSVPNPIVLAGRNEYRLAEASRSLQEPSRTSTLRLNLRDEAAVAAAAEGKALVINAAGPFQGLPLTLPRACLASGTHYIDLSDDRAWVLRVRELAASHTASAVCTGWSAVPALSAALVKAATGDDAPRKILVQIAPGNRLPRRAATVHSLLASVGARFRVPRGGSTWPVTGWSEPRTFLFPPPVGPRTGWLVDVPDHALFPELFGAQTVEFRVGSELAPFNNALTLLSALSKAGLPVDWTRFTRAALAVLLLTGDVGHDHGAIGVEVVSDRGATRTCIVADHDGHLIPLFPAVFAAKRILSGQGWSGLAPLDGWISSEELARECAARGWRLTREDA